METFITMDGAMVCVSKEFIRLRMNNGVVPRLLGYAMEDGLTTPEPSRNSEGHLTVLQSMKISREAFAKLLQLLRVGHIPSAFHQIVYDAAVLLGGFECVDAYLAKESSEPKPLDAHPMTPREDVDNQYDWTIQHMNITQELRRLSKEGWSVTLPVQGDHHVYLRRAKKCASHE